MAIEDIVLEATYPHAPELVWRVIATREGLASWLMDNDFDGPQVGHEFQFRDRPRPFWNGISDCRVIEAEPPRRLTLLWNHKQDTQPSRVSFLLTPTPEGGTHLMFRHSGLHGFMGLMMKKGMDKGWSAMVRHKIPFVAARMQAGHVSTRAEVVDHYKGVLATAKS